jgi:hypothetical protein
MDQRPPVSNKFTNGKIVEYFAPTAASAQYRKTSFATTHRASGSMRASVLPVCKISC